MRHHKYIIQARSRVDTLLSKIYLSFYVQILVCTACRYFLLLLLLSIKNMIVIKRRNIFLLRKKVKISSYTYTESTVHKTKRSRKRKSTIWIYSYQNKSSIFFQFTLENDFFLKWEKEWIHKGLLEFFLQLKPQISTNFPQ